MIINVNRQQTHMINFSLVSLKNNIKISREVFEDWYKMDNYESGTVGVIELLLLGLPHSCTA